MFVTLLFLLLSTILFFAFFEEESDSRILRWAWVFIGLGLTLLAGLRPIGTDVDAANYVRYFNEGGGDELTVEPSFQYIVQIIKLFSNSPEVLFFVYALLSIPLFIYGIQRTSKTPYLTLAVWVSHFFILQNLTQIRVAISEAFFLLGVYSLLQKQRWVYLLLVLIGFVFHYSAAFLLIGLFFSNREIGRIERIVLLTLPVASFVVSIGNIDFIDYIPIPYIQDRLKIYSALNEAGGDGSEPINYLNVHYLLKLMVYYFLLWKYNIIRQQVNYLPIVIRIFTTFIFFYVALASFPALARRISDLFCIIEVLFVPLIIYGFQPRFWGRVFVSIYVLGVFFLNVFYNKLLQF